MKNNKKLTKIVATLGPASDSEDNIRDLIREGVNVFRFNTKHGDPFWHEERIKRVQKVVDRLSASIGILLDLQGPELRLLTREGNPVKVKIGDTLTIGETLEQSDEIHVALPQRLVFTTLKEGDRVLIDDGYIQGRVGGVTNNTFDLILETDGKIKHKKGLNIPGVVLDLPSLIESDLNQLDMASKNKVDFVALSFVRSAKDIVILRSELEKRKVQAHIVAKIESQPAIDNIDEIIEASDAIMVARGDLGVEVPIEELAYWQKSIIKSCRLADKPVITATQMLESMIENPLPSRAEATDVANAVLDGTDALMLSAETAAGSYPVQAVSQMTKIAAFNEGKMELDDTIVSQKPANTTEQVTNAAVTMIKNQTDQKISSIVIFTETGYTARTFSSYRLNTPIIAVTDSQKTVETLTLSYGVSPFYTQFPEGEVVPDRIISRLVEMHILQAGDNVLVIHGKHWRIPGLTNSLTVISV